MSRTNVVLGKRGSGAGSPRRQHHRARNKRLETLQQQRSSRRLQRVLTLHPDKQRKIGGCFSGRARQLQVLAHDARAQILGVQEATAPKRLRRGEFQSVISGSADTAGCFMCEVWLENRLVGDPRWSIDIFGEDPCFGEVGLRTEILAVDIVITHAPCGSASADKKEQRQAAISSRSAQAYLVICIHGTARRGSVCSSSSVPVQIDEDDENGRFLHELPPNWECCGVNTCEVYPAARGSQPPASTIRQTPCASLDAGFGTCRRARWRQGCL